MSPWITGMDCLTAAGRGVEPLLRLLEARAHAFSELPPYPTEGLAQPRSGVVADLPRETPALTLAEAVAREALTAARIDDPAPMGLVLATSSGEITGPWERWHAATLGGSDPGPEPTRHGTTTALARRLGIEGPLATVSIACASGTAALVHAAAWLAEGRVHQVLVVGVDALSIFVHAGFDGLGALSATLPRPFEADRDGLLLGEGAAAVVLESPASAGSRGASCFARLRGGGLSIDGVHMTAPDRHGRGAARAMQAALQQAALPADEVDAVSVHGTGTPFNDAMEAQALAQVFGTAPPPVHTLKQAIGHTLGAAGLIEAVVAIAALASGRLPPGPPTWDPALPGPPAPRRAPPRHILSTSSAFGGMNAAVLLSTPGAEAPDSPQAPAYTLAHTVSVDLDGTEDWRRLWPAAPARLLRVDPYTRLGLLALHRLFELTGPPHPDTALLLATSSACRISDLRHHARILEQGAARAHRVAFAATIPGTPVAEAAILWGLRGPCQVLLGDVDPDEAFTLARHLGGPALVFLRLEAPQARAPMVAEASLLVPVGNSPLPPAGG